ncbi:MAG: hypothetical protein R3C59_25415 [Planctomycetaceae bacterium]
MTRFPSAMRFRTILPTVLSMLAVSQQTASAHPGHGSPSAPSGLMHYLTSPMHTGPVVLVAAIAAIGIWMVLRGHNKSDSQR